MRQALRPRISWQNILEPPTSAGRWIRTPRVGHCSELSFPIGGGFGGGGWGGRGAAVPERAPDHLPPWHSTHQTDPSQVPSGAHVARTPPAPVRWGLFTPRTSDLAATDPPPQPHRTPPGTESSPSFIFISKRNKREGAM